MSTQKIEPKDLYRLHQNGSVEMIDVRTPFEFQEVHANMAVNEPLDELDPQAIMSKRNGASAKPLYVICHTGSRASKACERFVAAGFDNVVNVDGGTKAWDAAGLPVVRGKKVISLERQVRIAAGLLVLTGALLGAFVNPWFIALSGFVGAGLMFAGITDTCGMGMLLAKMPWNRIENDGAKAECCQAKPDAEMESR